MGTLSEKTASVAGNGSSSRVADHRSRHVRLDVSVAPHTGETLDELAVRFDCSRAVVVRSLLRFALTNRDWKSQGLIWRD